MDWLQNMESHSTTAISPTESGDQGGRRKRSKYAASRGEILLSNTFYGFGFLQASLARNPPAINIFSGIYALPDQDLCRGNERAPLNRILL